MTLLEHTVPAFFLVAASVVAIALGVYSVWRYLPKNRGSLGLLGLYAAAVLALAWCLLLPGRKDSVTQLLKPRFLIALDTSRSMTQGPPGADADQHRWTAAQEILKMPWARAVSAECEIELFPLSSGLGQSVALGAVGDLEPDGSVTLLRDSLKALTDRFAGVPVAGALVLSDGIDTREAGDDWAAAQLPFPVYTARLEPEANWLKEPDLRIDSATTSRRVTVGWKTELKVKVSGQGTRNAPVSVQVFKNGTLQTEKPAQIPDSGGEREVTFELDHPEIGNFNYRIHVPPLTGEANTDDNEYITSVQVVDARNRLLYVEGVPRWDYKYMRRVLLAHEQISPVIFFSGADGTPQVGSQVGTLTADMTPAELALFKVVVIGNLDSTEIGPARAANLVKFVEDGGSLVLLGGEKAWGADGFAKTELAQIAPVRGALRSQQSDKAPFPVRLSDSARGHPAFAGDAAFWEIIPPVLSVFTGAELTPAAETLVSAETATGAAPIVAAQRYGQGKVVAVLTDSLWRWQLGPEASKNQPFQRFWTQLISWLLPEEEDLDAATLELFASYDTAYLGEEFEIVARAGGESPPEEGVTCTVTAPDGRQIPYQMAAREVTTSSGNAFPGYVLPFASEASGLHRATATAKIDGKVETSETLSFFVRPFSPETMPRPINEVVLDTLAKTTGGQFFETPDALDAALSSLDLEAQEEETTQFQSLWQNWPTVSALILLLGLTWTLRKTRNMP